MPKNLRDIKRGVNINLDLKGENKSNLRKKAEKLKITKYSFYKKKPGIHEVKDIRGVEKVKFAYIKGEKFTPPKFLGNLIRIAAVGFLLLLIINAVNIYYSGKALEQNVSDYATRGYSFLVDAGKDTTKIQFDQALTAFVEAQKNFDAAKDKLWFINNDKSFYSENQGTAQGVSALLEGGKYFASAGTYFLAALEQFNQIPVYFVARNKTDNAPEISITDILSKGLDQTNLAIDEISKADQKLDLVNENDFPQEIMYRITLAKTQVKEVSKTLEQIKTEFPAILTLLGDKHPHRYLILLQNNNEIRPTGGFIGSYAIMDVNEGYIEKLDIKDVYDLDGSFYQYIQPPEELKVVGGWKFRDSNYSPDFPTSAAKAKWFLQKEGGPGVDSVIAINQGLLKDLMEITGPVQVGALGKFTADNYNLLLSYIIEGKVWGPKDPKHILKVFIPAFKDAIMKEENLAKLSSTLFKAIQQKHILAWSGDADIENLFRTAGMSGEVHQSAKNEDYLSVIDISYGGTKSEQFIDEEINHSTNIAGDGEIIDEVTVKRAHRWTDDVYRRWKSLLKQYGFDNLSDQVIDILGRGRNKVYTRIYVPDGSIMISSSDPNLKTMYDKDTKKTYFLTGLDIGPGESKEVSVKYKLPFNLTYNPVGSYSLYAEKQPGSRGSVFTKEISADNGLHNLAVYPQDLTKEQNGQFVYATNLIYDRYFSSAWQKN